GDNGQNNNFGLVRTASIAGFVYYDENTNGIKDFTDPAIPNTTVTLTGVTDLGATVAQTQQTAGDGSYAFADLRPGGYTITETQPAPYEQGTNTVGSLGGGVMGDQFRVGVNAGNQGQDYNFGETLPPPPPPPPPPEPPPPPLPPEQPVLPEQ